MESREYWLTMCAVFSCFLLVKGVTVCPLKETILPCTCLENAGGVSVSVNCNGESVTQDSIENLFQILRLTSNSDSDAILALHTFELEYTNLESFDLTPLIDTRIRSLNIDDNRELTMITGPGIGEFAGRIDVGAFYFVHSPKLGDVGLGNTLRYLQPSSLKIMDLVNLNLYGHPVGELLPGLSRFDKLVILGLYINKIGRVGSHQFQNNSDLTLLSLSMNKLAYIDENAFLIDRTPESTPTLLLDLDNNLLSDGTFHPNHGLDKIKYVTIGLYNNKMETISESTFGGILRAGTRNTIYMRGNPIICDERVKWLKDEKDLFEPFVSGAYCVNDVGQTVFNSTLIP